MIVIKLNVTKIPKDRIFVGEKGKYLDIRLVDKPDNYGNAGFVAIDLPKVAAAPLAGDEEQLVVNVTKTGQVFLNDSPMALDALTAKLAAIRAARPDRQVFVRADQTVPYGQVMKTMAAVRESGLTKVGLVTEP